MSSEVLPQVQQCDQFINGKFVPSVSGEYIPLISPESGRAVAQIANSTAEDVELAVQAAQHAFRESPWRSSVPYRVTRLRALAAKIRENMTTLVEVESRITGRPIREMRAQLGRLPEWYDYFASVALCQPPWPQASNSGSAAYTSCELSPSDGMWATLDAKATASRFLRWWKTTCALPTCAR